jgi:hypothetical protein
VRDADIIEALRAALAVPAGRHLYGVLGSYPALERFAVHLQQASTVNGQKFPAPLSVNREILAAIPDDDFLRLAKDEARHPEPVRAHVERAFAAFLRGALRGGGAVVLANLELLFAYTVDLGLLRTLATDADQVILLLPGRREGSRVALFPEAGEPNVALPANLIAANHLWTLDE